MGSLQNVKGSIMTSLSFEKSPLVAACSRGGYPGRPVRRVNRTEMVAVDMQKWANLLSYKMETIPHYLYAYLSHLILCMSIAQQALTESANVY